ncbi:hypothetical protein J2Z76_002727 [Sedimentibacter acidaminivorans]|uniref:Uncharacterized protein n=1 Tax=Sedimentibacter acidaminivorans TaxID=913099 RepID=A0ABS4GGN4_9FIRM|nr:DUF6148 family protein [Sedimentibacter acidaminivorans]MBP1926857.1 hypothetical protein [Sedimentibacter acidaminivorans]
MDNQIPNKPTALEEYKEAKKHYDAWNEAELSVINGQSYQIGSQRLDRANLYQIREQLKYWRKEMNKYEEKVRGKSTNIRVSRITPVDF